MRLPQQHWKESNTMKTLRTAVIGLGFIGAVHVEQIRRIPYVEVVAVVDAFGAEERAKQMGVPAAFSDYKEMMDTVKPDCVHICTPNFMHREIALAAFERGINVVCEKPMAMNAEEAQEMADAAKKSGCIGALNFHNRYYPIPYRMRRMVENGDLGDVFAVQGGYLQDWLQYETDFSWKLLSAKCGKTRVTADLGSHWMDLAEYVSGQKITEVFAEFKTIYPIRINQTPDGIESVPIDTEDFSYVIVRFENGAIGNAQFSGVFSGKKNQTVLQVAGTKASMEWDNEKVNDLLIGHRSAPNELLTKDSGLVDESTATIINYPGGHAEGFSEAFKQNFTAIYNVIRGEKLTNPFATFDDGLHVMKLCDALYESSQTGNWVRVEE